MTWHHKVTDNVVTDLWMGCACNDDPDWSINPPGLIRPDYLAHRKAIEEHGNLRDDTPSNGTTGPAKQNKLLGILADWNRDPKLLDDYTKLNWVFFATNIGTGIDCRKDWLTSREVTVDTLHNGNQTFFPNGTFNLQMPGFDKKCEYTNDGDSQGKFSCPGQEIECKDDPHNKNPSDPKGDKGDYDCGDKIRQPVFICEY